MADLAIISRRHPTFTDSGKLQVKGSLPGIKAIPKDYVMNLANDMFMSKQYDNPQNTAALGGDVVFVIPRSYQYVGNMWLEITGTGTSVYDIGHYAGHNCIRKISVTCNDEVMCEYSGETLLKLTHLINHGKSDIMSEILTLSGDTADMDTTPMLVPILAPGSNLVFEGNSLSNQETSAWPVGLTSADMIITVSLNTGSYISKTNDFELASVQLKYDKYTDKFPVENVFQKNTGNQKTSVYWSWYYVKPIEYSEAVSITANTDYNWTTAQTVYQEGEVDAIIVDAVNATQVTDKEYMNKSPITKLEWRSGDSQIYQHVNVLEARLKTLRHFKAKNALYGAATGYGYIYPLPVCSNVNTSVLSQHLTASVNFNLDKPYLILQTATTAVHTLRIVALYKQFWNVMSGGYCKKQLMAGPSL